MTAGERIRLARQVLKLGQRETAKLVGINFTYLSKIENGRLEPTENPSGDTVLALCRVLEIDPVPILVEWRRVPTIIKESLFSEEAMRRALEFARSPVERDPA